MTQVYCIVGYPGAGKTAGAEVAEDLDIPVTSMGNQVRRRASEVLEEDADSDDIGEWATEQREKNGDDIVAQWTAEHILGLQSDKVVIEGVRSVDEVDVFESHFDEVNIVHVHAPFETRLQRLQDRGRDGEEEFTESDLQNRDDREDGWGVAEMLDTVDAVRLDNTRSFEEFKEEMRSVLSNDS